MIIQRRRRETTLKIKMFNRILYKKYLKKRTTSKKIPTKLVRILSTILKKLLQVILKIKTMISLISMKMQPKGRKI
jgi:hypothetical protein